MVANPFPYTAELVAGRRYSWCACGLSQRQPYCDGSHRTTQLVPVTFSEPESLSVALCGCKKTGNPPYCDGSHKVGPQTKEGG